MVVNLRNIVNSSLTGVQRYTIELLKKFPINSYRSIEPSSFWSTGINGHLWEQVILPKQLKNDVLWSPANTGPLLIENQILTIHDLAPIDYPQAMKPTFSKWYRYLIPKLAVKVRKIITVSEFSKGRILEICKVPDEKVVVIPNGISENFFQRPLEDCKTVLEIYSIPLDAKFLFTVSSIEPRKNLINMLKAWQEIVNKLPENYYFVIGGSFGNTSIFENVDIPTNLTRVIFTGRIEDKYLPMMYTAATGFIYMSFYEGFGLPVLESIACGTPALVANNTSLAATLNNYGILSDPDSIEEISDGIYKLLTNTNKYEIHFQKMQAIQKKHSWKVVAKLTFEEIMRIS